MKKGGFTLIEVLISLTLFTLAAVVLGGAYVNVLLAQEALRRGDPVAADAAWVRQVFLAEPELGTVERGDEVVLPDERTARWRARVTPLEVSDMFRAELEIELPVEGGEPLVWVETHDLLRPTWSEEADRTRLREAAQRRLEEARARWR